MTGPVPVCRRRLRPDGIRPIRQASVFTDPRENDRRVRIITQVDVVAPFRLPHKEIADRGVRKRVQAKGNRRLDHAVAPAEYEQRGRVVG